MPNIIPGAVPGGGGGGAPSGPAGGDLAGTYPNPTLAPGVADPAGAAATAQSNAEAYTDAALAALTFRQAVPGWLGVIISPAVEGPLEWLTQGLSIAGVGFVATRPGSVTGVGAVVDSAFSGSGAVDVLVRKNGVLLNAALKATLTVGGALRAFAVFAEGLYTFVAGDLIQLVYSAPGTVGNDGRVIAGNVEIKC